MNITATLTKQIPASDLDVGHTLHTPDCWLHVDEVRRVADGVNVYGWAAGSDRKRRRSHKIAGRDTVVAVAPTEAEVEAYFFALSGADPLNFQDATPTVRPANYSEIVLRHMKSGVALSLLASPLADTTEAAPPATATHPSNGAAAERLLDPDEPVAALV